jgi:hypothetical protein
VVQVSFLPDKKNQTMMKYCILWGLTFGIATFFQTEKPFQVYTGYMTSTEISAPGNFRAEVKCFNIILKVYCNAWFTKAEAEISFLNLTDTRNVKVLYNWPDYSDKEEKLLKVQFTNW